MPVLQLRRSESSLRAEMPEERARAAPFLKWVGGKTTLLAELLRHVPPRATLRRYHEPFGRTTSPRSHAPSPLSAASQALKGVEIVHAPSEAALVRAAAGDFVYLDPPYDPVSATSSFASYTADGFTWDDQKRLARACIALNRRGVRFLLSNSATERVRELYRGFEQRTVRAPRFINSKAESRGRVAELLVFNA